MAAGSYQITDPDDLTKIMKLLNDYSAPAAADSAYQLLRSLQLRRTDQTVGENPARLGLLRCKAESEM